MECATNTARFIIADQSLVPHDSTFLPLLVGLCMSVIQRRRSPLIASSEKPGKENQLVYFITLFAVFTQTFAFLAQA